MSRYSPGSALSGLLCLALFGCEKSPQIEAPPTGVQAIEARIFTFDPNMGQQVTTTRSTDPAAIQRLLALIKSGKAVEAHKCSAAGELVLHLPNGEQYHYVEILPGHDPKFYEVRRRGGQPFRVPRDEFRAALKALGVTDIPEKLE